MTRLTMRTILLFLLALPLLGQNGVIGPVVGTNAASLTGTLSNTVQDNITRLGGGYVTWATASTGLAIATRTASGTNAYGLQVAAPTGGTNNFAIGATGLISTDASILTPTLTIGQVAARTRLDGAGGAGVEIRPLSSGDLLTGITLTRIVSTLGTLTGSSTPAFSSTATWNNAAMTFVHDTATITDTSSQSASLLIKRIVGSTTVFSVDKVGSILSDSIKSTTGQRYVCVDTTGKLVSSAAACVGT